jgi:hypothetical protein
VFHVIAAHAYDFARFGRGDQPNVRERCLGFLAAIAPEDVPTNLTDLFVEYPSIFGLRFSIQGFVSYNAHWVFLQN